jgi:hypothetical protein
MANHVEFQDFSFSVKAELNETSLKWLRETGHEIASIAQRNCQTDYEEGGKQLKGTYKHELFEETGEVQIGSPLQAAYWEEFGTGEYADTSKNGGKPGRPGWWIYTPDDPGPPGYKSMSYYDEMEAMMMAAHIQSKYGKKAYVTNGRKPNYTLEKAFKAVKNPAIAELERKMKGLGS